METYEDYTEPNVAYERYQALRDAETREQALAVIEQIKADEEGGRIDNNDLTSLVSLLCDNTQVEARGDNRKLIDDLTDATRARFKNFI